MSGGGTKPPLRLRAFACEVLRRELELVAADSPNRVDAEFLPMSFHEAEAGELRARLQSLIDHADGSGYDAILLGYGLCNRAPLGLRATRTQIVMPRAYDCITLLLGSRSRYREYSDRHPGVCYRSCGWVENDPAAGGTALRQRGLFRDRAELAKRYGQDNADHLFEMLGNPPPRCTGITFIDTIDAPDSAAAEQARREAQARRLAFDTLHGDLSLLRRLVDGPWPATDFLVVPPGHSAAASFDGEIIRLADGGRTRP